MRRRLGLAVTLLQILILRPGNLLVKNHESLSINNESQLKETRRLKLKMLGPLCNQTDNLKTDAKTLHYSLLELKYSPSSTYLTDKNDWNKYASLNNSYRNHTNRIFYQKTSNRSFVFLRLTGRGGGWGGGLSFVSLSILVTDEKQGPSSLALYLLICSRVRRYIKQCNHIAKQSKQYRKLLFPRRV